MLPSMVPPHLRPITATQEGRLLVRLVSAVMPGVQNERAQGLLKEKVKEHLKGLQLPRY